MSARETEYQLGSDPPPCSARLPRRRATPSLTSHVTTVTTASRQARPTVGA